MKVLLTISMFVVIVGILLVPPAPYAGASDAIIPIYLDGQRIEMDESPIIVNDRVFLPMRVLFELFDLEVNWDSEYRTIESEIGFWRLRIQVGSGRVERAYYWDGDVLWFDRSPSMLDQVPLIVNGRTYVPMFFLASELDYHIEWDSTNRSVNINRPFVFRDGRWWNNNHWGSEATLTPLVSPWGSVSEIDDIIFAGSNIPDGPAVLRKLDLNGNARIVAMGRGGFRDVQVQGDYAFIQNFSISSSFRSEITRVRLDRPFYRTRMGQENFSYGMYITAYEVDEFLLLQMARDQRDFVITDDGVKVIGFDVSVFSWGEMSRDDRYGLERFKESYGYYLLPFDGSPHILIERQLVPIYDYLR